MEERAENRREHSGGRQDHAAARRIRMAQPFQSENKQDGGGQIGGFKKIAGVHFFSPVLSSVFMASFLRNILSMRSVIRNPPVTLIVAEVTAAHPRIEASRVWFSWLAPAMTREPISEMPEMALVADMSGVCSSGGTREITW